MENRLFGQTQRQMQNAAIFQKPRSLLWVHRVGHMLHLFFGYKKQISGFSFFLKKKKESMNNNLPAETNLSMLTFVVNSFRGRLVKGDAGDVGAD